MNGSVSTTLKNRPRIPTPDVSKESGDGGKTNNSIHGNQDMSSGPEYPNQYPLVQVSISQKNECPSLLLFEGTKHQSSLLCCITA